jgi:hypothetical protein
MRAIEEVSIPNLIESTINAEGTTITLWPMQSKQLLFKYLTFEEGKQQSIIVKLIHDQS